MLHRSNHLCTFTVQTTCAAARRFECSTQLPVYMQVTQNEAIGGCHLCARPVQAALPAPVSVYLHCIAQALTMWWVHHLQTNPATDYCSLRVVQMALCNRLPLPCIIPAQRSRGTKPHQLVLPAACHVLDLACGEWAVCDRLLDTHRHRATARTSRVGLTRRLSLSHAQL
jgi:hypothetical protein